MRWCVYVGLGEEAHDVRKRLSEKQRRKAQSSWGLAKAQLL